MEKQKIIIHGKEVLEEFGEFLYEQEYASATIKKYITDIKTFMKFLGEKKEVDKQVILDYKEWLQKHYMVSSANSMLASLNCFLGFQGHSELKVKRVKIQKQLMMEEERNLTKEEFELLRDAALEKGDEGLAMVMETIVSTGIRISELKFVTVNAVNAGIMEINNKGKYRIIPIPDILQRKLLDYIKENDLEKGAVFVTRNGQPQDRSNIWTQMKRLSVYAGVPTKKVYPHNLRHLFARRYYQLTQDLAGLADILGHSSIEVTRIYTADTGKQYRLQMNKLDFIKMPLR